VKEKNEEALKYFYIAKDLGRNDDWIYLHLYQNLKTTKGEEGALKYFEEQAKIDDKNPVLLEALGNIYMLEPENYEKAEKTFQKAFALSGDGEQLYNRGRALAALKKYEEAIEVLLQSRRISEQEGDVTDGEDVELVHCYIGLKDKKNAEKYLELAREGADNVADEFIDEYEEELDRLEDLIDEL
jgi:tetratricopeptide repeat family protein